MGFLVKIVDNHHRIFYATPKDNQGRLVDSRKKAEVFNDKLDAIKTALINMDLVEVPRSSEDRAAVS